MSEVLVETSTAQLTTEHEPVEVEKNEAKLQEPNKKSMKKQRYDGRSKKRRWENRRDDDNDTKRVRTNPEERIKKRKYCMLLGYAGANYHGMQRNPDVNTIEEELLKVLFKNKLIDENGFKQSQNINFQRAARTDKGVSAARQCCSMKLREFRQHFHSK